jgi:hypothetical protein
MHYRPQKLVTRVEKAFLITPLVFSAGATFPLADYGFNGLWVMTTVAGYLITLPLTLFFGVPAYGLLKRANRVNWRTCVGTCTAMGAIAGALNQYRVLKQYGDLYRGQIGYLVKDNLVTAAGYAKVLEMSLVCAATGAIGGCVFWYLAIRNADS